MNTQQTSRRPLLNIMGGGFLSEAVSICCLQVYQAPPCFSSSTCLLSSATFALSALMAARAS
ncbi:hypothetical protein QDQ20_07820, partial [Enterobacter hormaechei]|uniref:hypothetical protein n=1 Tax=Enterobacter hormaechei TaxID=158836 RepID=UPI00334811FB